MLKHAGPGAHADVEMRWTEHDLVVTVVDDGRGVHVGVGSAGGTRAGRQRGVSRADRGGTEAASRPYIALQSHGRLLAADTVAEADRHVAEWRGTVVLPGLIRPCHEAMNGTRSAAPV